MVSLLGEPVGALRGTCENPYNSRRREVRRAQALTSLCRQRSEGTSKNEVCNATPRPVSPAVLGESAFDGGDDLGGIRLRRGAKALDLARGQHQELFEVPHHGPGLAGRVLRFDKLLVEGVA